MQYLRKLLPQWLKDFALFAAGVCIGILSFLVPKKKGTILFYSTFTPGKFAGNLREVFSLAPSYPDLRFIWLTDSRETAQRLSDAGMQAVLYRGFPLRYVLRAEKILLDNMAPELTFGRFRIFQLWHGTGFKKIGLLNEHRPGLRRRLLRRHSRKAEIVVAGSADDAVCKAAAFASDNLAVTGDPRNDRLLPTEAEAAERRAAFKIPPASELIVYCPTFREKNAQAPFSDAFWRKLNDSLAAKGALFVVKKHPRDTALQIPSSFDAILDVTHINQDIQDLLSIADLLITDYSAISTDFALTGRPMMFYMYDRETYERDSRTFYYDLDKVLPGPFAETEDRLIALLLDRSWAQSPDYRERYREFRNRFHQYGDSGAARRVAELIAKA